MSQTMQDVINSILTEIPGAPFADSVDLFKSGNPSDEVRGIATTFTASLPVLREAVARGANLVITHEPTFYDHRDETSWLAGDPIYQAKRRFIEEHQLTIWRFHDYWHAHRPDGILTGVMRQLGWEGQFSLEDGVVVSRPDLTVAQLAALLKERLGLSHIRLVGRPEMPCRRIGMVLGAWGGENQIRVMHKMHLNVVLCGETVEWQTCEYVRDAVALGEEKALLILGHAPSEEAGMAYLVNWLSAKLPTLPISFIEAGNPVITL